MFSIPLLVSHDRHDTNPGHSHVRISHRDVKIAENKEYKKMWETLASLEYDRDLYKKTVEESMRARDRLTFKKWVEEGTRLKAVERIAKEANALKEAAGDADPAKAQAMTALLELLQGSDEEQADSADPSPSNKEMKEGSGSEFHMSLMAQSLLSERNPSGDPNKNLADDESTGDTIKATEKSFNGPSVMKESTIPKIQTGDTTNTDDHSFNGSHTIKEESKTGAHTGEGVSGISAVMGGASIAHFTGVGTATIPKPNASNAAHGIKHHPKGIHHDESREEPRLSLTNDSLVADEATKPRAHTDDEMSDISPIPGDATTSHEHSTISEPNANPVDYGIKRHPKEVHCNGSHKKPRLDLDNDGGGQDAMMSDAM